MILGDLLINDMNDRPPLDVMKALAVIARHLHPTFNIHYRDGDSLDSCILVSAVLRDFLFRAGFKDAEVRPVSCFIERRTDADTPARQLLIGEPGKPDANDRWNGHMVTVLPKTGWMIDCTLYQARRKDWEFLPGMVATPVLDAKTPHGRKVIGGFARKQDVETVQAMWIDWPENTRWRTAPGIIRGGPRERARKAVADLLLQYFQRATVRDDEVLV